MAYYPRFTPKLEQAGVKWLRLFPEWQTIQPRQGQWNWEISDRLVADARASKIQILGLWCYFAPWTSADGGTRRGPIKEMQYWRDYVSATVSRYHKDIKYWEVWNEFDGSFYEGRQGAERVKDYADLVVAAYDAAKQIDPDIKVGTCVGAGFLDMAIKAGAGNHFDFIAVHPYSNLGTMAEGGVAGYLGMGGNLRRMLAANKQRADIPIWITEFGKKAPVKADPQSDAHQANLLVKGYVLSLAQGIERVFWFETRGDSEDCGVTDFGIIRSDWTPRPAYQALKTMTRLLGNQPEYLGWLNVGTGGYGFVFRGACENELVAWGPAGRRSAATFTTALRITNLAGEETTLAVGESLMLSTTPVFIRQIASDLITQAKVNRSRPYPWGGDYARAKAVTCTLGFTNTDDGLTQVHADTTIPVSSGKGLAEDYRRTDFTRRDMEGHYVYFTVDPQFVPYGTRELEITVVAKRLSPDRQASMSLCYESAAKGYTMAENWTIPAADRWHEHTWKLKDANFANEWGWNFRFDAIGSANEILIKNVRVAKLAAAK